TLCLAARYRASAGGTKFLVAGKPQVSRSQDRHGQDRQSRAQESLSVWLRRREEFYSTRHWMVAAEAWPAWNGTDNRFGSCPSLWRARGASSDWKSRSRNKSSARRTGNARLLSRRFNR